MDLVQTFTSVTAESPDLCYGAIKSRTSVEPGTMLFSQ